MADIKYPRAMLSIPRHKKLATEARKTGKSIQEVAEAKFKIADKHSK